MAFYSLMVCDYCGESAISFCTGDACGQNNRLNSFLCDKCASIHGVCKLCQVVIRTEEQTKTSESVVRGASKDECNASYEQVDCVGNKKGN